MTLPMAPERGPSLQVRGQGAKPEGGAAASAQGRT